MIMHYQFQNLPPWLDSETSALVKDKIEMLASRHPDILAIILYGSVARHEERSLDEPDPSDVDLLAVFAGDRASIRVQRQDLFHSMGLAENRHLKAPREVNVMFTSRTSQEWDPNFIENVKRDGIILYQRGALPEAFAA
jgi:predicted nucleotidyltransferase